MVDLTETIRQIRELVDAGRYFVINRSRQYGKTTTLRALQRELQDDYLVISLSFEGLTQAGFQSEGDFVQVFSRLLLDRYEFFGLNIPKATLQVLEEFSRTNPQKLKMDELYRMFRRWIVSSPQPVVLLIDEVDSASNNQVFIDFLGLLRDGYISRESDGAPAFLSVVLAGVTDIRHLRSKIRPDDDHRQNSPWNIATEFSVDMSLSEQGIKGMLDDYEADHCTGMDSTLVAGLIRDYTDGYPFLVSRICQIIDTTIRPLLGSDVAWSRRGVDEAVKRLLSENNTLFQSLTKNLNNYPELKDALRSILLEGTRMAFNPNQDDIAHMHMLGLIQNDHGTVRVSNRIFETLLYNLFLSDEELKSSVFAHEGAYAKNRFVQDGKLNVRLLLERFIQTYHKIHGPLLERFKEKDGREQFLLYLMPIINGTGNYYIEAQTRSQTRTDVIVDYLGEQYIIELKIWRGPRYNADGEQQICEYLDYFGLRVGYMLSFNFNKQKTPGVHRVEIGDRVLYEATV
jgi:hypothetical protein